MTLTNYLPFFLLLPLFIITGEQETTTIYNYEYYVEVGTNNINTIEDIGLIDGKKFSSYPGIFEFPYTLSKYASINSFQGDISVWIEGLYGRNNKFEISVSEDRISIKTNGLLGIVSIDFIDKEGNSQHVPFSVSTPR